MDVGHVCLCVAHNLEGTLEAIGKGYRVDLPHLVAGRLPQE